MGECCGTLRERTTKEPLTRVWNELEALATLRRSGLSTAKLFALCSEQRRPRAMLLTNMHRALLPLAREAGLCCCATAPPFTCTHCCRTVWKVDSRQEALIVFIEVL
jgi:hypothetical protein